MAIVTRPKLTNTSGHHGSPMAQSDGQCSVLLQFDLSATLAPLVTLLLGLNTHVILSLAVPFQPPLLPPHLLSS